MRAKCRYSLHEASILHPCDLWAKKPLQCSQPTARRLIDLKHVLCSRVETLRTIQSRMLFDTTRKLQKTTRSHYNVSFFLVKTQLKRKHFGSKQLFKECLWEREKSK